MKSITRFKEKVKTWRAERVEKKSLKRAQALQRLDELGKLLDYCSEAPVCRRISANSKLISEAETLSKKLWWMGLRKEARQAHGIAVTGAIFYWVNNLGNHPINFSYEQQEEILKFLLHKGPRPHGL